MNPFKAATQISPRKRFSLQHAVRVCSEVEKLEAQLCIDEATMLEALRKLAEVLIYTDKHNEMVFDHIMGRDPMNTLERIATNADISQAIKLQVFKCLTIFFQNLTRVSSVYLAFSNNHLNRIIALEPDSSDDELTSMYISLLKSLALRLNKDTAQLFFEIHTGAFPLFDKAVQLLGSSDPMVRTAAKQIVVTIAQLEDDAIARFLHRAMEEVYVIVARSVAHQLISLGRISQTHRGGEGEVTAALRALRNAMENIVDDLFYLNDLCHTPQPYAAERLMAILTEHLLQPLYMLLCCALDPNYSTEGGLKDHDSAENDVPHEEGGVFSNFAAFRSDVPPETALGFLARWAEVNDVELLHSHLAWIFFHDAAAPVGGEGGSFPQGLELGGVIGGILSSERVDWYHGALLFWIVMRTKPLSELMHRHVEIPTWIGRHDDRFRNPSRCVLEGSSDRFACETVESTVSPHAAPPAAFFSPLRELDEDEVGASLLGILRALFTTLDVLVRNPCSGSLADVHLAFESIAHERARSPSPCLRRAIEKMAAAALQRAAMEGCGLYEAYAPLCEGVHAALSSGNPAGLPRLLEGGDPPSALALCVVGLGIGDVRVGVFLALKTAWGVFESVVRPSLEAVVQEWTTTGGGRAKNPAVLLPVVSSSTRDGSDGKAAADGGALPLFRRPPLSVDEREGRPLLQWLLLRQLLDGWGEEAKGERENRGDSLEAQLRRLSTLRAADAFPATPMTRPIRCEFVMVRCIGGRRSALSVAGSALRVMFTDHELLLAAVEEGVGGAWDLAYVRALGLHATSFRVIVEYHEPRNEAEIHLAFRTTEDAKAAVDLINAQAARCRAMGAALCSSFLPLVR
ncbi:unnamed protein product [Phytomonas sp. EM1]|nr:unnamed protein product [Phytomonas sp. EM1]|eukprot:CCW61361.1 unnamed protein product [Phytomonas sp. isolate EM1]